MRFTTQTSSSIRPNGTQQAPSVPPTIPFLSGSSGGWEFHLIMLLQAFVQHLLCCHGSVPWLMTGEACSKKSNHKTSRKKLELPLAKSISAPPPPNCQSPRPLRGRKNTRCECWWSHAVNCDHLKRLTGGKWMKKWTKKEVETLRDGGGKG